MSWQDEVESLFRKLKPVLGKEIDALWLAYNTQTDARSRTSGDPGFSGSGDFNKGER